MARTTRATGGRGSAFTLIELLVVIAVIAIVSAIVFAAFRGIARDARLSSGTNTVIAALGNARALAMKNSEYVAVVFRPRLLDERTQVIEIVMAKWTGQSMIDDSGARFLIDRFVPLAGVPVRRMPRGVKVAGPLYVESTVADMSLNPDDSQLRDDNWATQAQLTEIDQSDPLGNQSEAPGRLLGVMYGPSGAIATSVGPSSAAGLFIDFDRDSMQRIQAVTYDFSSALATGDDDFPGALLTDHRLDDDEPAVVMVPFLAVYDDEELRELSDTTSWRGGAGRAAFEADLRLYLTENANRVHFNSYTGVALR